MLAALPKKGTVPIDMDTAFQASESDEKLNTPFHFLSDKLIHIIAYGWDNYYFDDLEIFAALESLMLLL
jgi:hypothetical protein